MDANGELTVAELALLRTHPQRNHVYLAIPTYANLYTATVVSIVNVPGMTADDGVIEVNFVLGSGIGGHVLGDIVQDMTLLVASVGEPVGSFDMGIARIRKAPLNGGGGTGTFYIGQTSEIHWLAGQVLTVTTEIELRPKHPYVDPATGEEFMDYDVDYAALDSPHIYFHAVPNMFPDAVAELPAGGTVNVEFNAKDVWTPYIGAAAYTYTWSCDGAVPVAPNAVQTDITFNAVGTYQVKLELVTNYGGGHTITSIGYRVVIVWDSAHPLIDSPILERCEGDYNTGGWSYEVTCYSQAELSRIHDRTLCILVADDWYGNTHQSIGPIVDRENIVAIGWIDGESITRSNDRGNVSFTVHGPQFWLDTMEGFPTGVDDTIVAPTGWTQIEDLTIRKGLWHFLYWRTTATTMLDIPQCAIRGFPGDIPEFDERRLATTYTPAGSLWEQLRAIADRIFAHAACNRYGQLFINVDMQLVDPASGRRNTHPSIFGGLGLLPADWRDDMTIERRIVSDTCKVDLSGIYWSGTVATSSALFALSPGHFPKRHGTQERRDRLALGTTGIADGQAEAIELAGLYAGWLNNEYPNTDVPLSANNRCFDIVPYMFTVIDLASVDTPREIEWTGNKVFIPRRVSLTRDDREAVMLADVTFEAETFSDIAMIGDPPLTPPDPPPPPDPPTPEEPPAPPSGDVMIVMNATQIGRSMDFFTASPHWDDISTGLSGTFINLCISTFGEAWLVTSDGFYHCLDITVGALVWDLRMSLATAQGWDPSFSIGEFWSCAIDISGIGWTALTDVCAPVTQKSQWILDNSRVQVDRPDPSGGVYPMGFQFAIASSTLTLIGGLGYAGAANTCTFVRVPIGTGSSNTVPGYRGCNLISSLGTYAVNEGHLLTALVDMNTFLRGEVEFLRPVVELGTDYLWTKYGATPPGTTGDLMLNNIVQAIPNTVGADAGVFGNLGGSAVGGAYIFVDTVGHIAWVAHTNNTLNPKRNIAYTEDGGVTWETKDGDWATAIGAWAGGLTDITPVVARYVY